MSNTDTIRKALQETVGELVTVQVPPQYEHSISVVLNRSATENIKWRQLASEVVSKGEELRREGQIDVNRIRVGGRISGESHFEFQEEYEFTTSLSLLNRNQFKKVPRKKRKWISEPDSASYLILTVGVFLCVTFYLSIAEGNLIAILLPGLTSCIPAVGAYQKQRSFYKWWWLRVHYLDIRLRTSIDWMYNLACLWTLCSSNRQTC